MPAPRRPAPSRSAVLLYALLLAAPARAQGTAEGNAPPTLRPVAVDREAVEALLSGVTRIELEGVPGDLVVYGERTAPVLLDSSGRPLAALHADGDRRIIWLTHDSWFTPRVLEKGDNARFLRNALEAVSRGGRILFVNTGDLGPYALERGFPCAWSRTLPESLDGYAALVCNFRAHTGEVLKPEETARIRKFLDGGGSCIGIGIGWVFDSYGEGRMGAELADAFPGNALLSRYGACWGSLYASKTATANRDPAAGHLRTDLGLALRGLTGDASYPAEENRRIARSLVESRTAEAAVRRTFSRGGEAPLTAFLAGRIPVPTESRPVRISDTRSVMAVALAHADLAEAAAADPAFAEALAAFPSFGLRTQEGTSAPITAAVAKGESGWVSTGAYAPPGAAVRIRLDRRDARLGVVVGPHTDNLFLSGAAEWKRWPRVDSSYVLRDGALELRTPFGGIVYLVPDPDGAAQALTARIEGCIPCPVYREGISDPAAWRNELAAADCPWGEIVSDSLVITTTCAALRGADPLTVCGFWDRVLDGYRELSGHSPRRHRERVTFDVQIRAGFMHNGYPVMAHLDRAVTVLAGAAAAPSSRTAYDMWGLFHEFGHNWQKRDYTPSFLGEVTVNIFTLYANEALYGIRPMEHEMPKKSGLPKVAGYLRAPDPAAFAREPFVGLYVFLHLLEGFGWGTMRQVLSDFRVLDRAPASDAEKSDLWARFYSLRSGRNLVPYFRAWGLEAGEATAAVTRELPAWMPEGWPR